MFCSIIGVAITWLMSWIAIFGIYRKHRLNINQVSSPLDLDKNLQDSRLTLVKEMNKTSNQGERGDALTSLSTPTLILQMETLKESLEGVYQQLEEIKRGKHIQELKHRDTRRRLEKVEKNTHSEFFN